MLHLSLSNSFVGKSSNGNLVCHGHEFWLFYMQCPLVPTESLSICKMIVLMMAICFLCVLLPSVDLKFPCHSGNNFNILSTILSLEWKHSVELRNMSIKLYDHCNILFNLIFSKFQILWKVKAIDQLGK